MQQKGSNRTTPTLHSSNTPALHSSNTPTATRPIYVSGTVGINVIASNILNTVLPGAPTPSVTHVADTNVAARWTGQVICMYDVHNQDNYCDPPPNAHHLHIDDFLTKLNVCSIIVEEPFIEDHTLRPIFSTQHVHKLKLLYTQQSIHLHTTDIRLNMLNSSLHVLHEIDNKQTLLQYITPILSIFRTNPSKSTNPTIEQLYQRAIHPRPAPFYPEEQHIKLRKIKKEFLECLSSLPMHYRNQMIFLYRTLQQRLYEFVMSLNKHLDDDLYHLTNNSTANDREPLNKDFPFDNPFIKEYSNKSILDTNWLYRLEIIIDATMEMFTVGKLLRHWKPCNVVYMGLVHMSRISHWLKTYFSFTDVVDFGTTELTLPKYLDEIPEVDSCVVVEG